tara:strand:- start:1181 stop:1300 length:120 start_codon:yes stop_codon:yes gene_type:complete
MSELLRIILALMGVVVCASFIMVIGLWIGSRIVKQINKK